MDMRDATSQDVPAVVRLLAEDRLGSQREEPGEVVASGYLAAFEAIDEDPLHRLVVAEVDGEVVGTLQLSFLPGMSYQGGWRAQVEAVRIAAEHRGRGLGHELLEWAIEEARRHGCVLVQLTTNKVREDAHRFYASLGFEATHEGMKLHLT